MARSAEAIVLSEVEREELDRLVRAHSTPQQLALRTQIILLAADGIGNRDSARRLGVTVQTVRCWRRRWDGAPDLALVDRLADAPRPGTAPTFTPEQICAILALACEPPEASGGADHALEPERAGPRSGEAGTGRNHLPRLGRFLKGG